MAAANFHRSGSKLLVRSRLGQLRGHRNSAILHESISEDLNAPARVAMASQAEHRHALLHNHEVVDEAGQAKIPAKPQRAKASAAAAYRADIFVR